MTAKPAATGGRSARMPTTVCMEHRDWALSHHARPTHFLLYLNFETLVGDHGAQLAEEVRKAMAAKHKRELMDAGAPAEVAEKQIKELDDLAQLESKQLGQQDHVIKKKEAAALAELKAKAEAEAAEAENEEVRAELVNFPVTSASQCLF